MTLQVALFEGPETQLLARLEHVPGWTPDPAKDPKLLRDLQDHHPMLDLGREIDGLGAWMGKNQERLPRKVNLRARLRTWCENAERYRDQRGRVRATRSASLGACPEGPEAFGPSSP